MAPLNSHNKKARRRWTIEHYDPQSPSELSNPSVTSPADEKRRRKGVGDDSWQYLKTKLQAYDQELVNGLRDELDTTLVFAGLFSAIVTTFLAESYKNLQPDDNQAVVNAINRLSQQLGGSSTSSPDSDDDSFSPPTLARVINILWFFAVVASLFAALFALLIKQWLRTYLRWFDLGAKDALRVRQLRFLGIHHWDLQGMITILLPTCLQVSLVLFIAGLIVWLFSIDRTTMYGVVTPIGCFAIYLGFALGAPLFSEHCPYRSPLSIPFRRTVLLFKLLWLLCLQSTRYIRHRSKKKKMHRGKVDDDIDEIIARLSRKKWTEIDRVRSRAPARRVQFLNSVYEWMRLNIQDKETFNRLVDKLGPTNSLCYVLEGGKRRQWIQPRSLQDVLVWNTLEDEDPLDPEIVMRDIRAIFLSATPPQEPKNAEALLAPATSGIALLIELRAESMSKQQLKRLAELYWEMFLRQHLSATPLDLGALQEGLDALYRFVRSECLDQASFKEGRRFTLAISIPNHPAMEALLLTGCRLTLDPRPAAKAKETSSPQSRTIPFSIFRMVLLFMGSHDHDERINQLFHTFCKGMLTLTAAPPPKVEDDALVTKLKPKPKSSSPSSKPSHIQIARDIPLGPRSKLPDTYVSIFNIASPKVVSRILPLLDQLVSTGFAEDPHLIDRGILGKAGLSASLRRESKAATAGGGEDSAGTPTQCSSSEEGKEGSLKVLPHLVVDIKDPLAELEKKEDEDESDEAENCDHNAGAGGDEHQLDTGAPGLVSTDVFSDSSLPYDHDDQRFV